MELTERQIEYLELNESIFGNTAASMDERFEIYAMYNQVTGENKKPNSCGRCWRNVKKRVYQQYLKQTTHRDGRV